MRGSANPLTNYVARHWHAWGHGLWCFYSHACGLLLLSVMIGFGLVQSFAKDGPVIRKIGDIDHIHADTNFLGSVGYEIDLERFESCPGQWTATLTSHTNHGPPAIVTITRPVSPSLITPGVHEGVRASIALPESVFPGVWTYVSGVTSQCPTRSRYDELARFDFTVSP